MGQSHSVTEDPAIVQKREEEHRERERLEKLLLEDLDLSMDYRIHQPSMGSKPVRALSDKVGLPLLIMSVIYSWYS